MSHLTDRTKLIYVPVIKDANNQIIGEGADYGDEEAAIQEAHNQLSMELNKRNLNEYIYAVVETRIVPIYY
jgi:hypothetical protein